MPNDEVAREEEDPVFLSKPSMPSVRERVRNRSGIAKIQISILEAL